jgi:hypothetical protein
MTTTMTARRGSPPGAAPLLEATGLTVRFGKVTALDARPVTEPAGHCQPAHH